MALDLVMDLVVGFLIQDNVQLPQRLLVLDHLTRVLAPLEMAMVMEKVMGLVMAVGLVMVMGLEKVMEKVMVMVMVMVMVGYT